MVTCRGRTIGEEDLAFLRRREAGSDLLGAGELTLEELERRAIAATLARWNGNVKRSAEALGIDRSTLYDKIRKYKLTH